MRAEEVIYALLNVSAINALVGNRITPMRAKQNDAWPALVTEYISGVELAPIAAGLGNQVMRSRVQVTAFAKTYAELKALLEQVRSACNYQSGTIAGVRVISVLRDSVSPDSRDDQLGLDMQSIDFMVTHYET